MRFPSFSASYASSALIGAAAFIALFRYQIGIIPVIGACGALGLIDTFLF